MSMNKRADHQPWKFRSRSQRIVADFGTPRPPATRRAGPPSTLEQEGRFESHSRPRPPLVESSGTIYRGALTAERSSVMTLAIGAYFFLIAFVLAHLEIQIEGPHGWAEKLPTWRWDGPGVRRWLGKPVTGYHLSLVTVILLFLHVPHFYGRDWEREADLLAMFFFLTVTWDVLWFACNRHFGMARFRKGQVW